MFDNDMYYRPEPDSAFDLAELQAWEARDEYPEEDESLLDPTGGWDGWEDQPEWV
jgi:hypothetical protein